jgi:hypothetical protein
MEVTRSLLEKGKQQLKEYQRHQEDLSREWDNDCRQRVNIIIIIIGASKRVLQIPH